MLAQLFPTRIRYIGISVAYQLSTVFVMDTATDVCQAGHVAEAGDSPTGAPAASTAVVR